MLLVAPRSGSAGEDATENARCAFLAAGCAHGVHSSSANLRADAHRGSGTQHRTCVMRRASTVLSFAPLLAPCDVLLATLFVLAGDVYEQGVVLSVKQKDEASFERNFQQLRPYYADVRRVWSPFSVTSLPRKAVYSPKRARGAHLCRHMLQQSPNEQLLTGLNLLRLLVHNRTAEFHVELELIPQAVSILLHIL